MIIGKSTRHKKHDVPVMDKGKLLAPEGAGDGLGNGTHAITLARNTAKPGKPLPPSAYGDPDPSYWQRRANPGEQPSRHKRPVQIYMPERNTPKGGTFNLEIGDEWSLRVKRRLMEIGWRYIDLVYAVKAIGVELSESHLRNMLNGHAGAAQTRRDAIEAVLFGGGE